MTNHMETLEQALEQHKKGNLPQAEKLYREVLVNEPDNADALHLLGMIALQVGKFEPALALINRSVQINPDNASALASLGNALVKTGRPMDALTCYRRAVTKDKNQHVARLNLCVVLEEMSEWDEAISHYTTGLQLLTDDAALLNGLVRSQREACQWEGLDANVKKLKQQTAKQMMNKVLPSMTPFQSLALMATPAEQHEFAKAYAAARFSFKPFPAPVMNAPEADKKLKIAYLSGDFRNHPTGHLMRSQFGFHNRKQFHVTAYAIGADDSEYRKQIEAGCDRFVDVAGKNALEIAKMIRQDGIDILVDVMGYIHNAHPEILALKPAPVQVSYLAYPGTMGASFMDYIITDEVVMPKGDEKHYAEKALKMPHTYFVTDETETLPKGLSKAECGFSEKDVVLACFNRAYKIDEKSFAAWMDVLRKVPAAKLWLMPCNKAAEANLRAEAAKAGVDVERLVFAQRLPKAEHLARLQAADLFLDTFTVGAHTTAIDSLKAGVPVLSLMGDTIISRASSSIVKAAGMNDMVTDSVDAYVKRAVALAKKPADLKKMKKQLLKDAKKLKLFDTKAYVAALEKNFRTAWAAYCDAMNREARDVGAR